jgi:hypothetical protein
LLRDVHASMSSSKGPLTAWSGASAAILVRCRFSLSSPSTLHLQLQQLASHHEQIGERDRDLEAIHVRRQPAVEHLLKAETAFHDAERVFDLSLYARLRPFPCLDSLVEQSGLPVMATGAVPDGRRMATDHLRLSLGSLIAPNLGLATMQTGRQSITIGHVDRRYQHGAEHPAAAVDRDLSLHAEVSPPALRCLARLGISFIVAVRGQSWRADDYRINDRAVADLDPDALEVFVGRRQQLPAEPVTLEEMAELEHSRLVRRRLTTVINAGKAAHRGRVVQRLVVRRVPQVKPLLQDVYPQHALLRQQRALAIRTRLRVERLNNGAQLESRHDSVQLRKELPPTGRPAALLKPGPCLLMYRRARSVWVFATDCAGKPVFY